jgi:hypothetical protein
MSRFMIRFEMLLLSTRIAVGQSAGTGEVRPLAGEVMVL